jgi:hypothetical protein
MGLDLRALLVGAVPVGMSEHVVAVGRARAHSHLGRVRSTVTRGKGAPTAEEGEGQCPASGMFVGSPSRFI